ncbi:claudin-8-like [Clarias gariepinus]|uniref:claudin-8-like n=1 Tax=Clarias gariepinus TaxID=13013 RepID=UPI00234C9608|nr:claudin-8-like [Clarias gariepinus]
MVEGVGEIVGFCLGVVGLIGASAVTGLPMWRVSAFIQENIIVMETRWEGLWMNCYRQANIRMQCKVYDSLLYLPPELQASRGLMCCSVGLSFFGLVVSLPGLHSVSCFPDKLQVKSFFIAIGGSMEIMSCICVLIAVSWTAHTIIQDFYDPLLISAQRRELGEALYIGWVTAFILFCSGIFLLACRNYDSNQTYQLVYPSNRMTMTRFQPATATRSSISSTPHQTLLLNQQPSTSAYSVSLASPGGQVPFYNIPVVYPTNMIPVQHYPSLHSSYNSGRLSMPGNPLHSGMQSAHPSPQFVPPAVGYDGNFVTAVQPTVSLPPMVGDNWKKPASHDFSTSHSSSGMYI